MRVDARPKEGRPSGGDAPGADEEAVTRVKEESGRQGTKDEESGAEPVPTGSSLEAKKTQQRRAPQWPRKRKKKKPPDGAARDNKVSNEDALQSTLDKAYAQIGAIEETMRKFKVVPPAVNELEPGEGATVAEQLKIRRQWHRERDQ